MIGLLIKALAVCGACAWIAAFTPSTHSNQFLQILLDAINFVGGNIHRAKNQDDKRS
jgi:hypothetical protein